MPASRIAGPVVAGVDGSEPALDAVRWAAREAARRRCPLRLVAAVEWTSYRPIGVPALGQEQHRDVLLDQAGVHLDGAVAEAARVDGTLDVERDVVGGAPTWVFAEESRSAELLVLGHRGSDGFPGLLAGSVSLALAAASRCPLVVVRGAGREPAPVVVGVDGSVHGTAAVGFAFEAAALRVVPMVAVRVWSDTGLDPALTPLIDWHAVLAAEEQQLEVELAGWRDKFPEVDVRRRVVRDHAAGVLVEESADAQLVVVGSRGRGGLAGTLLGSVGRSLVQHAHCPTVVVHEALSAV